MLTGRSLAGLGVLALLGVLLSGCGDGARPEAAAAAVRPTWQERPSERTPAVATFKSPRTYDAVAAPVRLRIPKAGVDTGLERLRADSKGTIATPKHPNEAGWYADGPKPGQPGPAVILGHVDSKAGPAVFFHVAELRRSDIVLVDRADHTTVRFAVTQIARVAKTHFPTQRVYSPTLQASLRLITCGGTIDPRTGHYRDNVIVYASPA